MRTGTFRCPAIQRQAGRDRLINVIFTYLDFHVVDDGLVDLDRTISNSPTEFDLNVTTLSGLLGLSSNTGVFDRAGMNRLSSIYDAVLTAMAADPDGDATGSFLPDRRAGQIARRMEPAGDLPQRRSRCTGCSNARCRQPRTRRRSSSRAAAMSYAELNAKANRLAHHLLALGARPGTLVGVCLDRGFDLVSTLLAVVKTGAGYLPIDPEFPADRRDFMLADAGAKLLVSRSDVATELRRQALHLQCSARRGRQDDRPAAGHRSAGRCQRHRRHVRHLHVGLDRPAQGGRRRPRQCACAFRRHRNRFRVRPRRRVDDVPFLRLRFLGVGTLGAVGPRRHARRRSTPWHAGPTSSSICWCSTGSPC